MAENLELQFILTKMSSNPTGNRHETKFDRLVKDYEKKGREKIRESKR